MLPDQADAQVLVAPGRLEPARLPITPVDATSAVLAVEVSSLCGSDVALYRGTMPIAPFPLVLGHEPVGTIVEIGDEASRRWGVVAGDRVVVESVLPCDRCDACAEGHTTVCRGWPGLKAYGYLGPDEGWGPNGAFATHLWLHPNTRLHKVDRSLPLDRVAMFNALAAGAHWAVAVPELRPGQTVLVLGPGQRGLACVIAARAAGAGTIVLTGLPSDRHKLDLGRRLGADLVLESGTDDVPAAVREVTEGRMADIAVDVASGSTQTVLDGIASVRPHGKVILAGHKDARETSISTDDVFLRSITIRGVASSDSAAFGAAVRLLEDATIPIEAMHTHAFGLDEADLAIRTLAGETGDQAIGVSVRPGGDRA